MSEFQNLTVMQMKDVISQLPEPEFWMKRHATYNPPPCKVMLFDYGSVSVGSSAPFDKPISEYSFKVIERGIYYDWELML